MMTQAWIFKSLNLSLNAKTLSNILHCRKTNKMREKYFNGDYCFKRSTIFDFSQKVFCFFFHPGMNVSCIKNQNKIYKTDLLQFYYQMLLLKENKKIFLCYFQAYQCIILLNVIIKLNHGTSRKARRLWN